jgi:hypothetical protein
MRFPLTEAIMKQVRRELDARHAAANQLSFAIAPPRAEAAQGPDSILSAAMP